MRIGIVCPYSFAVPGGVQNHVLGLAGWLSGAGDEVGILGPGQPTETQFQTNQLSAEQFTSVGEGVALRWNGSTARVRLGPGSWRATRRWLDLGWDVVNIHEPLAPSIGFAAVAQSRVPTLATCHTQTESIRLMRLANQALRRKLFGAVAVSQAAAEVCRASLGFDPMICGNGLWLPEPPSGCERDPNLVTFLGRFDEPRKGLALLLEAWPEVLKQLPHLKLVVAGPGNVPRAQNQLPMHTKDSVSFLGEISDNEKTRLLYRSSVYVAPNLGGESFGIILTEALAASTRIVASDLEAFRAVLTDADQRLVGRLFATGDAQSLAEAIVGELAGETATSKRRRSRALDFSWDMLGPRIRDELYRIRGMCN